MNIPSSLKPTLWGAAWGAGLLALVGFTFGGWTTAGTAERTAQDRATTAVVAALAPICLSQFQLTTDAVTKQVELSKISMYDRQSFVEKAGWATMPGSANADAGVAKACADLISKAKL
jgi:alpha/beta superfamily hydrolase